MLVFSVLEGDVSGFLGKLIASMTLQDEYRDMMSGKTATGP
jgi:hypothetical protein